MVSSSTRLISIERSGMIDIHPSTGTVPSPWCHRREARVSVTQLTVLTISHHMPDCKTKLDDSTLSFACFTWLLGLSHKNHFLPTNIKPQRWSTNCFFDSPLRALCCRCHIHYSWRNRHPTSHFYMVQPVCQSWNQSRVKHVRSVFGPLQSYYATDINECTWEGNNEKINAHILLCVLIVQAYYT
jgi:hypothetical protein